MTFPISDNVTITAGQCAPGYICLDNSTPACKVSDADVLTKIKYPGITNIKLCPSGMDMATVESITYDVYISSDDGQTWIKIDTIVDSKS